LKDHDVGKAVITLSSLEFGGLSMAINPPSDIVLDVVNAADPSRLEAAQAKLKAGQAALQAQRLASTDNSFDATIARDHIRGDMKLSMHDKKDVPQTYRKFESMVLSNFLKTMMPDSDEIYGKGATGEIWKGMMAEKLADEISKNGGIGIADSLAAHGATRIRQKADADDNRSGRLHMATQLIDEKQMNVLDKLLPGAEPLKKTS
jgi:Rod binding domain-containing protein